MWQNTRVKTKLMKWNCGDRTVQSLGRARLRRAKRGGKGKAFWLSQVGSEISRFYHLTEFHSGRLLRTITGWIVLITKTSRKVCLFTGFNNSFMNVWEKFVFLWQWNFVKKFCHSVNQFTGWQCMPVPRLVICHGYQGYICVKKDLR